MLLCEWFNSTTINIQNFISTPLDFFDTKTPTKYNNVLSSLKKSNNKFKLELFNNEIVNNTDKKVIKDNKDNKDNKDDDEEDEDDDEDDKNDEDNNNKFISSHKYEIIFNDKQHNILKDYFKECKKVYDLCVDIWSDYKNCTTNWKIFKDVLFEYLYRNDNTKNLPIENIKKLIIDELKNKQNQFNLENDKNKKLIEKLKKEINDKYNKEMIEYNKKVKENKNKTIKDKLVKPKKDKIKIDKIKNPPKPRGNNIKKPAPDEMLKSEIKEFCKNLSNAKNQAFQNKKTIDDFVMKHKNITNSQTISISKRGLSKDGIFSRTLGKIECNNWKNITKKYPLNKECKLMYDNILNKYLLCVVFESKEVDIKNRKEVVALDPGEKIFNYFYSNELEGKLGDEMRIKIIGLFRQIKKYQSIIDKKKNNKGKKLKNKKLLKKKIRKLYLKIKGYVNEVHKKSAKFLCENYRNILIPEFKTKPMISKYEIKKENERIKKIKNKVDAKKEIRKLNKRIKLSSEVKFVLSCQSHYKFKEYLKASAKRYKTDVYEVDESYTSQCCTICGMLSKKYDNKRTKICAHCGFKIDRDTNGSRNIYLKSICSMPGNNLYDYQYDHRYGYKFEGSKFNHRVLLPRTLTHLTFGHAFNCVVELPNSLTHLTFDYCFNQYVLLAENLTHLTFGNCFNCVVKLPDSLTHLTFGYDFNQVVKLPDSIIHLTFGVHFNRIVKLPMTLTHLSFGVCFNQKLELPHNLSNLTFGYAFNQEVELPISLTHLTFGINFNRVVRLPMTLTHLTFGKFFNQPLLLNENLTHLTFGEFFNQPLLLNENLTHLTLGFHFNQEITLNVNLSHLTIGYCFNRVINLPSKLKYLKLVRSNLDLIENLPNSIEELVFGESFHLELNNLPNSISIIRFDRLSGYNCELNNLVDSIEILELPHNYKKKIKNIPQGLKKIIMSKNYVYIEDFKKYNIDLETY